jgi:LuxR family maltose regulon positive regulatory protein
VSFALELRPGVPLLPAATIERGRLLAALDGCTERPLTLVGAPAGWGKTVLLTSWAAAHGAAWLTIRSRHLDAATFQADVERAIPGPGVPLVLDDVHRLRGGGLDVLREVAGDGAMRIVAAGRVDPDLRLGRLRLEGRLAELRAPELAFTEEECGELLSAMGVALSAAGVARLVARTEGWPAGLRLAALSLAGEVDRDAFVAGFAGDDGAVADYLTTEVLAGQPPRVREFLLRTSVPDRLCGELAGVLTDAPDAALMLEQLAQGGMFLSPLDRRRTWFRYHGLFRELLRTRLRLEQPGLERELHARAAAWLAATGHGREAVEHALAGGDAGACDGLLAEQWLELLLDGQSEEVVAAAAARRRDPRLAVVAASGSLDRGDGPAAQAWLEITAEGDAGRLADLLSARARADIAAARTAGAQLLAPPRLPDGPTRAVAQLEIGVAEFELGSPERAAEHFEAAGALAWEAGADRVSLGSMGRAAALEAAAGRLVRAEQAARTAIALAQRRRWHRTAPAAWGFAALGAVHWHRNELDDAERRGDAAAAAAHASADRGALLAVRALRAQLAGARGDADRARGLLRAVVAELPAAGPFAQRWLDALGPTAWAPAEHGGPIAEATAWLRRGDPLAALRRVESLAEQRPPHPATALHAHLVTAAARHALGRLEDASSSLEQALAIANGEGFRRAFAGGLPVRRLLERHLDRPTAYGPLVVELLDALQRPDEPPVGLLEPLSERERAVLRLLPTQLSYPEIGGELFVAANTVKTHVKSIYRKLDVASRREAVARARALRLL